MNTSLVTHDPDIGSGAVRFISTRAPVKNVFDDLQRSSLEGFLQDFSSTTGDRAVAVMEAARERLAADAPVA